MKLDITQYVLERPPYIITKFHGYIFTIRDQKSYSENAPSKRLFRQFSVYSGPRRSELPVLLWVVVVAAAVLL